MHYYNKYIVRHLVHSTLLITFSLTSIVWLTQALRFIDFIVNQGVSIMVFLQLTVLLIPSLMLMILPPALFASVLFVYNKLKMDSELIVMQAVGLSRWRLALPALEVAAGVSLVAYFIAMIMQPASYSSFREMQIFLRNNYASILLQEGVFSNPVEGLTVFIRERDKDGTLHGILVHDNRQLTTPVTMLAEQGTLVETPKGPRFLLENGNRQEMRDGKLSLLNFSNYTLDISLYTSAMNNRTPDAQELPFERLFMYDPSASEAENLKRYAEGHQRLVWPMYPIALTLVALASLLSGQFNRRGHWQRITMVSVIGVGILFAGVGLRGAMALRPELAPLAYVNVLVPALASCWILADHMKSKATRRAVEATS